MAYDPRIHHRRSIRLKDFDYSSPGGYFLSICVRRKKCLFGQVADYEMRLNDAGQMIQSWWLRLPGKFRSTELGEYIVMPNHFHGTIIIGDPADKPTVGADPCVCPQTHASAPAGRTRGCAPTPAPVSADAHAGAPVSAMVQWFKTMTTNAYVRGVRQYGWCRFSGKLWQRNYFERVIRDQDELDLVRQYVINNPAKWGEDRDNPLARNPDTNRPWTNDRPIDNRSTHPPP